MSLLTAILFGIGLAFAAGLIGWCLRAKPYSDPLEDEIGDYPNTADLP